MMRNTRDEDNEEEMGEMRWRYDRVGREKARIMDLFMRKRI